MVIKQKHHDYYNSFSRVYIGCKKEDGKKVKKKKSITLNLMINFNHLNFTKTLYVTNTL